MQKQMRFEIPNVTSKHFIYDDFNTACSFFVSSLNSAFYERIMCVVINNKINPSSFK